MAGARATEVLAQLIDNYQRALQLLQAMRAAVATKMQQRYTQAAHTLRSASANVGATSANTACGCGSHGWRWYYLWGAGECVAVETAYATVSGSLQMERQSLDSSTEEALGSGVRKESNLSGGVPTS